MHKNPNTNIILDDIQWYAEAGLKSDSPAAIDAYLHAIRHAAINNSKDKNAEN